MRTFSHCARVSRNVPCTNSLSGEAGGRPILFRASIHGLSVAQEQLASQPLLCHNKAMQLTYRFRLSDTCNSELTRQARAVNFRTLYGIMQHQF